MSNMFQSVWAFRRDEIVHVVCFIEKRFTFCDALFLFQPQCHFVCYNNDRIVKWTASWIDWPKLRTRLESFKDSWKKYHSLYKRTKYLSSSVCHERQKSCLIEFVQKYITRSFTHTNLLVQSSVSWTPSELMCSSHCMSNLRYIGILETKKSQKAAFRKAQFESKKKEVTKSLRVSKARLNISQ